MNVKNPVPAVDLILEMDNGQLVLIERRNPPYGWALPGGFVDYGESLAGQGPELKGVTRWFGSTTVADNTKIGPLPPGAPWPERNPRRHCISTVFLARAGGVPQAGDDAKTCALFPRDPLPSPLAFDPADILKDYLQSRWQNSAGES